MVQDLLVERLFKFVSNTGTEITASTVTVVSPTQLTAVIQHIKM